jgi:hypothetical protein
VPTENPFLFMRLMWGQNLRHGKTRQKMAGNARHILPSRPVGLALKRLIDRIFPKTATLVRKAMPSRMEKDDRARRKE